MKKTAFAILLTLTAMLLLSCADNSGIGTDTDLGAESKPLTKQTEQVQTSIENNKPVTEGETDPIQTIPEITEPVTEKETEQSEVSPEVTEPITEEEISLEPNNTIIPDQNFIGVWSADEYRIDEILIYEVASDSVKFNTGIFREFGFTATAVLKDGEFVFGDGISPGYCAFKGLTGRLRFGENSITVIYDSFGIFDYREIEQREYVFTIKAADSDYLVNHFKSVRKIG